MTNSFAFNTILPIKVWVLAPYLTTADDNINYYYDFSQSIAEYSAAFAELEVAWKWQPVTMLDFEEIITAIKIEKDGGVCFPVVFNICDGDEVNGTPGISVINTLERMEIKYTGSDAFFYNITTSKIPMKAAFDRDKVATATWEPIHSKDQDLSGIFNRLGTPVIVKPSVSGGSMGVGIKNVVHTEEAMIEQVQQLFSGYHGWNLALDGLIAETFIKGEEYTTLIVGSYDNPGGAIIYNPVERVFHDSLPDEEKFLSFDRLWEIYDEESAMPENGNFYEYEATDEMLSQKIKELSWQAFAAVKGNGYTRVDIRRDKTTGKLYVLEVNAQCGLSEDEDFTSIGAILKVNNKTFVQLVQEIITQAFAREDVVEEEPVILNKKIA